MNSFSDRMGITKPRILQVDSMDDALRNAIWNFIYEEILIYNLRTTTIVLAREFFRDPVHRLNESSYLPQKYDKMQWWEIYNLFEFCVNNYLELRGYDSFPRDPMNSWTLGERISKMKMRAEAILEEENSGFRFIGEQLCPISNDIETGEIEEAMKQSNDSGFEGAELHLQKATRFISQKPNPDYRNSIKESISAVESVASLIAGQDKANLGSALNTLKQRGVYIHSGMDGAFRTLFGYTCDENGIRHAILDESEPGFDEAKFMLVTCSAFINFLILKTK